MTALEQGNAQETWRAVPGWDGLYEVSDRGRVRSLDRVITYSDGRTARLRGRIIRQTPSKMGVLAVGLHRNGHRTLRLVHQLVLEGFIGPRPPGKVGCHGPAGQTVNTPDNLRWDTFTGNNLDRQRDGTDHQRNKTECPREHLLVSPNLDPYRLSNGHRVCLACLRATANRINADKRGEPFDFRAAADAHYARIMGAALWRRLSKAEQIAAATSFTD